MIKKSLEGHPLRTICKLPNSRNKPYIGYQTPITLKYIQIKGLDYHYMLMRNEPRTEIFYHLSAYLVCLLLCMRFFYQAKSLSVHLTSLSVFLGDVQGSYSSSPIGVTIELYKKIFCAYGVFVSQTGYPRTVPFEKCSSLDKKLLSSFLEKHCRSLGSTWFLCIPIKPWGTWSVSGKEP